MRYLIINHTYETIRNTYKANLIKTYNDSIFEVVDEMDTTDNYHIMLEDSDIIKGEENFKYYTNWYLAEGYEMLK